MTHAGESRDERYTRLTPEQMRAGSARIKELVAELRAVDVTTTKERGEERFEILVDKINGTLAEIFGKDTVEYDRFSIETLDTAKVHMMYEIPLYEVKKGYVQGIEQAISNLRAVIALFGEKLLEWDGGFESRAAGTFSGRGFDPIIKRAVEDLFTEGKYEQAVAKACEALENKVRKKSVGHSLSAFSLMQYVFNPDDPVLRYNDEATEAKKDEQRGMMLLFVGAMMIGGNVEARARIASDPERTLEFLSLVSFLATSFDSAG